MSEETIKWKEQWDGNPHEVHTTINKNGEEYVIVSWWHAVYEMEVTYEAMLKEKWEDMNLEPKSKS